MVEDGRGGSGTGMVTVTVMAVNDPPVAVADSATTQEDTLVQFNALANDSDPDGDALTLVGWASEPDHSCNQLWTGRDGLERCVQPI